MIQIQGVHKFFGNKQNYFQALKDVNLTIPDGASVAIVGKSGSGKSTLMHAMSGLDRPQQGQVLVNGYDILQMNAKAIDQFRSRAIGFIFQSFFVEGNETCFDNVSLPLEIAKVPKNYRKKLVETALARVDLADKIHERAKNLSGGQKQRLAIARAIVNNPQIIFADEPTGNLDSVTSELVETLLFGHNQQSGATLIIVTHDDDLAKKCDMQIHIKDGAVEKIIGEAKAAAKAEALARQRQNAPQPAGVQE